MTVDEAVAYAKNARYAGYPHRYSPTTAGEIAKQLLLVHPDTELANREDIEELVRLLAVNTASSHLAYFFNREHVGYIGSPGTWISIIGVWNATYQISATQGVIFKVGKEPEDPTVLKRLDQELLSRIERLGGSRKHLKLIRTDKSWSGRNDQIIFKSLAQDSGEDSFTAEFGHRVPPYGTRLEESLEYAAKLILAHTKYAEDLKARRDAIRSNVVVKFGATESTVGKAIIVTAQANEHSLEEVHVAVEVTVLNEVFTSEKTIIHISEPNVIAKGEYNSEKVVLRDQRRRVKKLAGRNPLEAYTICPIVARQYQRLSNAEAGTTACKIREYIKAPGKSENRDGGIEFIDGCLFDTVHLSEDVTYRRQLFMAKNASVPQTLLTVLPGKDLTKVCNDDRLEGLKIYRGRVDTKNRLIIRVEKTSKLPLEPILKELEERSKTASQQE